MKIFIRENYSTYANVHVSVKHPTIQSFHPTNNRMTIITTTFIIVTTWFWITWKSIFKRSLGCYWSPMSNALQWQDCNQFLKFACCQLLNETLWYCKRSFFEFWTMKTNNENIWVGQLGWPHKCLKETETVISPSNSPCSINIVRFISEMFCL